MTVALGGAAARRSTSDQAAGSAPVVECRPAAGRRR
jgi:hypothetical protein